MDTLAKENLKIQAISNLISKGRIDEAFKKFGDLQLQNDHRKQLILISGKWHTFQYKKKIGTIQKSDEERQTASISESLINLLDSISTDFPGISIYNPKKRFWRRFGPLYVVGSASLVIGMTALMLIIPWATESRKPNSLAVKVKTTGLVANYYQPPIGEVEIICDNDTFFQATNSSGHAEFEGLPDFLFNSGRSISIRFRDQENEFLVAEKPDSAYKIRKEELIELHIELFTPELSGVVVDSETGKPIMGAEISMGNLITNSDKEGGFRVKDDSVQKIQKVLIQKEGYQPYEQVIDFSYHVNLANHTNQLFELKAIQLPDVAPKKPITSSSVSKVSPPPANGLVESSSFKAQSKGNMTSATKTKKSNQPSDEYYISIGGINYDRKIVELADSLVAGRGDGRISMGDSKRLLPLFEDEGNITQVEEMTLLYILENYNWTDAAKRWLKTQINDTSKPSSPATLGPLRIPID